MTNEKPVRSVYRVNYYLGGSPVSAFVCAYTETEAAYFLGVRDGSASASTVCSPIEIVGIDKEHAALPIPEPSKAPPAAPKQFTDAETAKLRALINTPPAPPAKP